MSNREYLALQIEEIETLQSIYDHEFTVINEEDRIFEIKLSIDSQFAIIQFTLPNEYPDSPPMCEIGIPWIRGQDRETIENQIQNIAFENIGSSVIYQIVESIREELQKLSKNNLDINNQLSDINTFSKKENLEVLNLIEVFHGEPFVDRKSTFQAHIARVRSEDDVTQVNKQLMSNNKVAIATHNISAYRIRVIGQHGNEKILQSCDDDGENKASERLLNMLVLMGVENIYVVISRWFGGIKLGADRFKHINNTAKDAIVECGWFSLKATK